MKINFRMKDVRNKFLAVIIFAVCAIGFYSYAKAQTKSYQNDFVLEPGKMEVFLNPGDTQTRNITVTNRMPTAVTFKIESEDFIGSTDKDSAIVLLGSEKSPYSLKDYLIPDKTEFTLNPGEKLDIPIKIEIPANAQPGGFYASILVSNEPTVDSQASQNSVVQGGARLVSRVGVLFFVRVNGPVEEKGSLEDFYMQNRQSFYSTGPYLFESSYQNEGTVHLVPYGLITISNLFGSTIGSIPVDAYFAMPKSIRYRELAWQNPPFLFGRYTATIQMHRGYGSDVDTKSVSFWVIPWKLVIIAFISLLIIISLAYVFFRKFEFRRK